MISKKITTVSAALLLIALTGCATMSKDECLHADWYIKGLEDANLGYALSRIAEHAKACARVKVTPVISEYDRGHKKGARLYCTPEKGYSVGRNGAEYQGICPQDLEASFLRTFRDGQELYNIQRNINNIENDIEDKHSSIQSNRNEIQSLKNAIVDRDSSSNERSEKLQQIDRLQRNISNLEIDIDRAIHELELFRHDYQVVENKHVRMGYIR